MHLPISDYIRSSLLSRFATHFEFLTILLKAPSLATPAHSLPQPLVQMAFWALLVLLLVLLSQRKPIPRSNAPGCRLSLRATLVLSYFLAVLLPAQLLPVLFCHPFAFLSCVFTDLHLLISYQYLKFVNTLIIASLSFRVLATLLVWC